MREIKFRTWDSGRGEWLQESPFALYGETTLMGLHDLRESDNSRVKCEEIKNLIPCQFTGLKDKNGKEIYEGDILKDFMAWGDTAFREVFWGDGEWLLDREFTQSLFRCLDDGDHEYVVAGNIYEHSYLLDK